MSRALPVLVVLTAAVVTAQAPSAMATIEAVSITRLSLTFSPTGPNAPVNPARGPVDVLVIDRIERPTED